MKDLINQRRIEVGQKIVWAFTDQAVANMGFGTVQYVDPGLVGVRVEGTAFETKQYEIGKIVQIYDPRLIVICDPAWRV